MFEINGGRLWSTLMDMSQLGRLPNGGSSRLALSDEDRAARDLFAHWAQEAGAVVQHDCFGNIFAIRPGTDPDRPIILTGSHLDTQPSGGHFDGAFGVLAGIEILRAMNERDYRTTASIGVVNWTNEEGVRFAPGLTGSSGFAGRLEQNAALELRSTDGAIFGAELIRIGYAGNPLSGELRLGAYIEAHIEQGPILENGGKSIGVVEGVQGVRWYELRMTGASRHAGTTPMNARSDAFMAAAALTTRLRETALRLSEDIRLTFGRVEVAPGSPNTIPGSVKVTIDLRHPDEAILDQFETAISAAIVPVKAIENVEIDWSRTMLVPSVAFDLRCVETLEDAARNCGYEWQRLTSGAMHDASSISFVTPTAMLFVPCRGGISHHESEWTDPEDLTRGCQVLAEALTKLAA